MIVDNATWILIILTLPTQNATARMRIWRGLKSLGCAALRDGAWLLPETVTTRPELEALADETRAAGGTAWVLRLDAEDAQSAAFRGMFDRSSEYAGLLADMAHFDPLAENVTTANKTLKTLRRRYEILVEQDYFPGAAARDGGGVRLSARWRPLLSQEPHFQDGQPASFAR
jgi:DNA-binding transcriptional regulator PaaX